MFIVIETHGGPEYAIIVADENDINLVFESEYAAQQEANNCENGIILEVR